MYPNYIIAADNPLIGKFKPWFQNIENVENLPIELFVSKHAIKHNATSMISEALGCLQHFPTLMDRFTLGTQIRFEKESGNGYYHSSSYDWVNKKSINWFDLLRKKFPPALFFINDNESRMYSIIGDHIITGKVFMRSLNKGMSRSYFTEYHDNIMRQRLMDCASFFYVFCQGTGFDPTQIIEEVYRQAKVYCPMSEIIQKSEQNMEMGNPYGTFKIK